MDWVLLCNSNWLFSCLLVGAISDGHWRLAQVFNNLFLNTDWSLWPIFWHHPACREPVLGLAPECQVDHLGFCFTILDYVVCVLLSRIRKKEFNVNCQISFFCHFP